MIGRESSVYQLEPFDGGSDGAPPLFWVYRNGRRMQGVIVERFESTVIESDFEQWLRLDVIVADPTRRGAGQTAATYATTILVPLPEPFEADFLLDYSVWPPR